MAEDDENLPTVMLVDDDEGVREVFGDTFSEQYDLLLEESGESAIEFLRQSDRRVDAVITDVKMPGMSGMELLKKIKSDMEIPVIVITGYATVDLAVDAMKEGAYDFIVKPFDFDQLEQQIDRALEISQISERLDHSYPSLQLKDSDNELIAASEELEGVIKIVKKVSDFKTNVLLTGETGTGKELIAQAIHYSGKLKDEPFVPLNCAALPENLLESELFGYRKGAFTDAKFDKQGKAEVADGGTLFLDEISEVPGKVQAKLLRLVQAGEIQPLGSNESMDVDIRVIAASNKNLEAEVEAGRFREDLYYRLNVIPIHLPPLRDRKEEIKPLAEYFLEKLNEKFGLDKEISDPALEKLTKFDWPGNIRELENKIERAILISEDEVITLAEFEQLGLTAETSSAEEKETQVEADQDMDEGSFPTLEEMEERHIRKALSITGDDKDEAAELLGIHRSTLYRKLKKVNEDEQE